MVVLIIFLWQTMSAQATRQRIVTAADELFYQQGFEHTSFADIATRVNISRGNFYYHFKSKDEILDAVIAHRLSATRAMLDEWEGEGATPLARVCSFVHILIANQAKILLYGCPVGTLSNELVKLGHPAQPDAARVFTLFRSWLGTQFRAAGEEAQADALAMHVLAFSQGVATLAAAYRDKDFVEREVAGMCEWLRQRIKTD